MKLLKSLAFAFALLSPVANAQTDFWALMVIDDFTTQFPFYETVRGTEATGMTTASCSAGSASNDLVTLLGKHECRANTAATVQITKTTAVTVLGISVLGISASPQAYVHMTAIAP